MKRVKEKRLQADEPARQRAPFWWRGMDRVEPEHRLDRERNHRILCEALADMAKQRLFN